MKLNFLNHFLYELDSDLEIWDLLLQIKDKIVPICNLPMPPANLFTHATFTLDEGFGDNVNTPYESYT